MTEEMRTITYEYLGLEAIPDKSRYNPVLDDGTYLDNRYAPRWYEGSEVCREKDIPARIKELHKIGKYRNIKVL